MQRWPQALYIFPVFIFRCAEEWQKLLLIKGIFSLNCWWSAASSHSYKVNSKILNSWKLIFKFFAVIIASSKKYFSSIEYANELFYSFELILMNILRLVLSKKLFSSALVIQINFYHWIFSVQHKWKLN